MCGLISHQLKTLRIENIENLKQNMKKEIKKLYEKEKKKTLGYIVCF